MVTSCKKDINDAGSLYYKDGEVSKLYFNVENGINIVVLGDGFVGEDLKKGGVYDTHVKQAIDQLFTVPPFKQYKKYFNTYVVHAESKQRGLNWGYEELNTKTKFNVYFTGGSTGLIMVGNYDACEEYIKKAVPISKAHLVILISNETSIDAAATGSYAVITSSELSKRNLVHEVGHAFALLGDEYVFPEIADGYPMEAIPHLANLDVTNDPTKVKWAHYLENSTYNNVVGIFEGGYYRANGVYRPEENSVMRNGSGSLYFNAPSREAIVRRIHQIMDIPFDFNRFLKQDDASIQPVPLSFQGIQSPRLNDFIGFKDKIRSLKKGN